MSPSVNHVTGVEASYPTFALISLCFRLFSLKDVTGGKPGHVFGILGEQGDIKKRVVAVLHYYATLVYNICVDG